MNLPRSPFSLKADLPVGFPYRFNSRKYHNHTYPNEESLRFGEVKKNPKKQVRTHKYPLPVQFAFDNRLSYHLSLVILLLNWYLWFEFPAIALSLRSADKVGRPFCCCIVFSFLFLFYYFISFPLSAFCDFSAIFDPIFLIFCQLIDNNL